MECITIVRGTHGGPHTMLHYLLEWKISDVRRIQNRIRLFHLSIIVRGYFLTVCSVTFRSSRDRCSTVPVPIACPILFISLVLTLIKAFFNFLFPSVIACISQVICSLPKYPQSQVLPLSHESWVNTYILPFSIVNSTGLVPVRSVKILCFLVIRHELVPRKCDGVTYLYELFAFAAFHPFGVLCFVCY